MANEPVNDSIISDQNKIIELKTLEVESIQHDLSACNERTVVLTDENAVLGKRVKRNRTGWIITGVGVVIVESVRQIIKKD